GLRAGIAVGVLGVVLIALVTLWLGGFIENWLYANSWFGASDPLAGMVLTGVVGVALLAVLVRFLFTPGTEARLVALEEQGWFTLAPYKKSQGLRVRRGTMLGVIVLLLAGVWTVYRELEKDTGNWNLTLPFTGRVIVTPQSVGDNPGLRKELGVTNQPRLDESTDTGTRLETAQASLSIDRFQLRDTNRLFQQQDVKITDPKADPFKFKDLAEVEKERPQFADLYKKNDKLFHGETFEKGQVVSKAEAEEEARLRQEKKAAMEAPD